MIASIPRDSYHTCKRVKLILKRAYALYQVYTSIDIRPRKYYLHEILPISKELPEEQPLKVGSVKGSIGSESSSKSVSPDFEKELNKESEAEGCFYG